MNILFLLIGSFESVEQHEIYPDLVRKFREQNHNMFVVCSNEKRSGRETGHVVQNGVDILRVKIGNITKSHIIEKGIATLLIEYQYRAAIKKFYFNVKFDLVIYATPPITLEGVISYIKKRDNAKSYLMLKDIFPQNALDLSILQTTGLKGMMYRFFRYKEKRLYEVSDYIGCMSEANCQYIVKHNPQLNHNKLELCPNCLEMYDPMTGNTGKKEIREKYGLPLDKLVFVYGGNLGKPQGIPFLLECLKTQRNNENVYFVIVGDGTEYGLISDTIDKEQYHNVKLLKRIPSQDYDVLIRSCDVGMIFLDHRFTIPNFPSRILSYMYAKLPVIACTDTVTDIRQLIEENDIGWWCESSNSQSFVEIISQAEKQDLKKMGENSFEVLKNQYNISVAYDAIMGHFDKEKKTHGTV